MLTIDQLPNGVPAYNDRAVFRDISETRVPFYTKDCTVAQFIDAVNVRQFGAVGDGVTDDTTAIQAAIDYAIATNRTTVHLGDGTFYITRTINFSNSGTKALNLIGNGGHSTRFLVDFDTFVAAVTDPPYPKVLNISVTVQRCVIAGFTIETIHGYVQSSLIYVAGNGCLLKDLWAGGGLVGFDLSLTDSQVSGCIAEQNQTAGFRVFAYNTTFTGCNTYRNWYSGFKVIGTTDPAAPVNGSVQLLGCASEEDGHALAVGDSGISAGFYLDTDFGVVMSACTTGAIRANEQHEQRFGIYINSVRHCVLSACSIRGAYGGGIFAVEAERLTITGCIVDGINLDGSAGANQAAVYCGSSVSYAVISGNQMNNIPGPALYSAAFITNVTGNVMSNCAQVSAATTGLSTQAYMIFARASANVTVNVNGNSIYGSTATNVVGVRLEGTASATRYLTTITNTLIAPFSVTTSFSTNHSATELKVCFLRYIGDSFHPVINSIASTPDFIGQVATDGSNSYLAQNTSSSGDWQRINN